MLKTVRHPPYQGGIKGGSIFNLIITSYLVIKAEAIRAIIFLTFYFLT
ncbi:hypothetical protein VL20_4261 [Microcystis panniformis FACHB-1757]|uniref:Uncharacterized protein n=1 Tax=Microcystis panniformis FACHB-1757 TaxID=1638788 RepID=A0A0K1S5E5_9CHRO|nr:hypothetical protein VL20_4261 [Microcystis panniformis FACHB-1757]